MTQPDDQSTTTSTLMIWGAMLLTCALLALLVGWLVVVGLSVGRVPVYSKDGTVQLDQFARAKDIFVLLLPLMTTAAGFWLGSQQTGHAQKQAAAARATAKKATDQQTAILSVTPPLPSGKDVLTAAKEAHPEYFDLPPLSA